jgi:hypothetical protein
MAIGKDMVKNEVESYSIGYETVGNLQEGVVRTGEAE